MNRLSNLSFSLLALCLAGCASAPPPVEYMSKPLAELEAAVAAGAEEHAPVDLRFAREKLESARSAEAAGDFKLAQQLAAQSVLDSEVARVRAESAQARRETLKMERRNRKMRDDMEADR